MIEKPLDDKEFEARKLIVNAKYGDDATMMAMASWTYEQYLWSRWWMKKNSTTAVCAVDPSHDVTLYFDRAKTSMNVRTGEEKIEEMGDMSGHDCEQCLGRKRTVIVDEMNLDDLERVDQE